MSDRMWTICGTVVTTLGVILMAVGGLMNVEQQAMYWLWVLTGGAFMVVLGLPVVLLFRWRRLTVLAFLHMNLDKPSKDFRLFLLERQQHFHDQLNKMSDIIHSLRQVRFVDDFGEYCDSCREMLCKSTSRNSILTLQTPVPLKAMSGIEKAKYDEYIHSTVDHLVKTDVQYRRLVVLKGSTCEPEEKIKAFVRTLVDQAAALERNNLKKGFDLSNVFIGFVLLNSFPDLIYANLDIHIPTENDFSLAFLSNATIRKLEFGGSLHLYDIENVVARHLREDMEAIWSQVYESHSFVDFKVYGEFKLGDQPKSDEQKNRILSTTYATVDNIVARLKKEGECTPVANHRDGSNGGVQREPLPKVESVGPLCKPS